MDQINPRERVIGLAKKFVDGNALIIDTETTGLDESAEIVEIAIIDAAATFEFVAMIKPERPIPERVTQIHGITNAMVEPMPSAAMLWPIVRGVIADRHLLAYNSAFDAQMMEQSFGLEAFREWDCLMHMFLTFEGLQWRGIKLDIVCGKLGIEAGGHRALPDAKAAREVLRWLARQEV